MNVPLLVEITRLLGRCLGPILDEWQPVLLMDTAPIYFAKACLRAAATAAGWLDGPVDERALIDGVFAQTIASQP